MRRPFVLALAFLLPASTALAQVVAPLVTPDGHVACLQGMTGIGHPPRWEAVADHDAPHGWALAETRDDPTSLHFPLCICQGLSAQNLSATLRFKPVSGTKAKTAGLLLRAQNATDYYVVAANALDGSVRLFRMAGGRRAQLAAKQVAITSNQWHALRVVMVDDRFEVSLDGALQFKAKDRSLTHPGALGVWSQSDSLVHFGTLVVGPAP